MTDICRDWPMTQYNASFRGVSFEVNADQRTAGRRLVTHEYANREFWDVEDMGRQSSTVQVTGFVHKDDSDEKSQLLLAACDAPGSALLVLPLRPPRMAHCRNCYSTFEEDALGRFAFEMEFVLVSGGQGGIFSAIQLAGLVNSRVAAAINAVTALFDREFNSIMRRFSPWALIPSVARDASADGIRSAADAINGFRTSVTLTGTGAKEELATRRLTDRASDLAANGAKPNRQDTSAYVRDQTTATSALAKETVGAIAGIADGAVEPEEAARQLSLLVIYRSPALGNNTDAASVRAEQGLRDQIDALIRRTGLLYQIKSLARFEYGSKAKAISTRADISTAFAAELLTIEDPATSLAMLAARDAAMDYISGTAIDRPQIVKLDCFRPLPAIVLATQLYDDAGRDAEIVDRNHARHPLYMPLTVEAAKV